MESIKLNDGLSIPALGLGTWQGPDGKEQEVGDAVKLAIELGYRLIDCAHLYGNEKLIGDLLREVIDDGKVNRNDLFIVSKVWNTHHQPQHVEEALKTTLENLQLDYLDLYLMHWPQAFKYGDEYLPMDANGEIIFDAETDYVDTWKAMINLRTRGLVKSIGVSNFNSVQLDRIIKGSDVIPAINQIECHPYFNQEKLRKFCSERDVAIMAYSPLGSPTRPWAKPGDPDVLNDDKIAKIAESYGKTPAQIILRYLVQLGISAIPKSSNPERLKQNIDIFNFQLTEDIMKYIHTFSRRDGRICPYDASRNHPDYPFNIEY